MGQKIKVKGNEELFLKIKGLSWDVQHLAGLVQNDYEMDYSELERHLNEGVEVFKNKLDKIENELSEHLFG